MKLVKILAILALVASFSCKKTMSHKIRLKNDSSSTIGIVNIGSITFRDTKSAATTEYYEIPEGDYEITGDFTASITISAKKKDEHLWTIQVSSDQGVTLIQDK